MSSSSYWGEVNKKPFEHSRQRDKIHPTK